MISRFVLIPLSTLFLAISAHAINIQRWHTDNGTQILLVERHELPIVDYAVIFKGAGSTAEPNGKSDIAAATAQMVMRGTPHLSEEQFSEKINDLGAKVSGSMGLEYSIFGFRSLSHASQLNAVADLFSQAITQPSFDENVLKRLQNQASLALKQAQSQPDYLVEREQIRLNYPHHPYGKSAQRSEQTIRAVQVSDLKHFHQNHYAQSNAIVTVVGDIDRTGAEKLVQHTLRQLPHHPQHNTTTPPVPIISKQISRIPFDNSTQANISMGLPVLTYDDPDYFALLVGNYVLGGGGFDSRLMKELRDKLGYTYGAYSHFTAHRQAGPFNIGFTTERKNSEVALAAARKVLADFVANGATEEELRQAKANITGSFPLHFDSNSKLLDNLLDIGLYDRPTDWLDTFNDKINALSVEDIKRAWQKHIRPDEMNIVIVGGEQK